MTKQFRQGDIVFYRAQETRELVSARVIGHCGKGLRKVKIQARYVIKNGTASGGLIDQVYVVDPERLIKPQKPPKPARLLTERLRRACSLVNSSTAANKEATK